MLNFPPLVLGGRAESTPALYCNGKMVNSALIQYLALWLTLIFDQKLGFEKRIQYGMYTYPIQNYKGIVQYSTYIVE